MAKITFPQGQEATITYAGFEDDVTWVSARLLARRNIVDITASTANKYIALLAQYDVLLNGYVDVAGAAVQHGGSATLATSSNALDIEPHNFIITKQWQLRDITGSGSTEKAWGWEQGKTSLAARMTVIDGSQTIHDQATTTLTCTLPGMTNGATFIATGYMSVMQMGQSFRPGGPINVDAQWQNVVTTYTKATADFWLADTSAPYKADASLAFPGAANPFTTQSTLLYDMRYDFDMRTMDAIYVRARLRFDEAAA